MIFSIKTKNVERAVFFTALLHFGSILVIVTYSHLLKDPFFEMSGLIFSLLALVVYILMVPREKDGLSMDALMKN